MTYHSDGSTPPLRRILRISALAAALVAQSLLACKLCLNRTTDPNSDVQLHGHLPHCRPPGIRPPSASPLRQTVQPAARRRVGEGYT